jgi:hypothetical protein
MSAEPFTDADPAIGTWGGVDFGAVKTLITHQRRDIGSCICGWGVDTGDLGRLHSLHVWRELQRAVLPAHDARVRAQAGEDAARAVEENPGPDPSPAIPAWWSGWVEGRDDAARIVREVTGASGETP